MKQQTGGTAGGGFDFNYWKGRTDGKDRYHLAGEINCNATTTQAIAANWIGAMPFYCTRACTWDRLAVYITVAGAGVQLQFGIYAATSAYNPYPGALLYDQNLVVGAAAGLQWVNPAFTATGTNLYWLTINNTYAAGPVYRQLRFLGCFPTFGLDTTYVDSGMIWVFSAFGPNPNPFPAGGTLWGGPLQPAIGVRFSS